MVVRRVGVLSAAKISGIVYAAFGVIVGAFFALMAVSMSAFQTAVQDEQLPAFFGAIFGVGAIIVLPIMYGCMGFLGGALFAAMYNGAAGIIGGLEIETEPAGAVRG